MQLLKEYASSNSQDAFAVLVQRHVNLVYSVALRHVGDCHKAQDVTQVVFIILAQKAARLQKETILTGWLYQTARLTSASFLRGELRRQRREHESFMQSTLDHSENGAPWEQLEPLLDDAMGRLGKIDRDIILLRFFEGKSASEAALALGMNELAAKKRITRAIEKLRKFFTHRGVTLSADVLTAAVVSHSVQAAPSALAKSITAVAVTKGAAAGTSTLTLIKGALKIMAWTKAKTVVAATTAILLAGGTTTVVVTQVIPRLREPTVDESYWQPNGGKFTKAPPVLIIRPTKSDGRSSSGISTSNGKALELNTDVTSLLNVAYGIPQFRMVLPGNLPTNRFDLLLTLTDHPREALQAQLKKRFGLTAHIETRDTDGFALKIARAGAPGLVPGSGRQTGFAMSSRMTSTNSGGAPGMVPGNGRQAGFSMSSQMTSMNSSGAPTSSAPGANTATTVQGGNTTMRGGNFVSSSGGTPPPEIAAQLAKMRAGNMEPGEQTMLNGETLGDFAQYLQLRLGQPVVDQTGTTNRFDIKLAVNPKPDESAQDALKRSMLEQLGLELAPDTEPVEMLIVQKSK